MKKYLVEIEDKNKISILLEFFAKDETTATILINKFIDINKFNVMIIDVENELPIFIKRK